MTARNETLLWKVLIPLAAALIAVGGLAANINSNSREIAEEKVRVTEEIKKNDAQHIDFIKGIQKLETGQLYIAEGIDEIKEEIKK